MSIALILLIVALIFLVIASFNLIPSARVVWLPLGLACVVAALILRAYGVR
jgi:hypothetical protein